MFSAQVLNKEVMAKLKAEKFDLAFAHMYDMCPFGLIHMLEIPTTIWMSSSVMVEHMALLGECHHHQALCQVGCYKNYLRHCVKIKV